MANQMEQNVYMHEAVILERAGISGYGVEGEHRDEKGRAKS